MRSMKNRHTVKVVVAAVIGTVLLSGGASSCDDSTPAGQAQEDKSRQDNYNRLIKTQPAHTMDYSPTRETKNRWIDTWGRKGKVAYVYLRDSSSHVFGYYVTDGLPVSYCTSLIPPYQIITKGHSDTTNDVMVPAPSVDGTFSSSANCNEVYAFDAVTGAYLEWNIGLGINHQISDQPLPQYGDAKPLGPGTIAQAKKKDVQ